MSCDEFEPSVQEDITTVQKIGGYAYAVSYGSFLLFIFIAAIYSSKNTKQTKSGLCGTVKNIGKRMMTLRSIYFVILMHNFDTLTDILILLEWYVKGVYEINNENCSFPSINYMGCFYFAVIILFVYRSISAHYVYKYYQQSKLKAIIQCIFQFLDLSILYEVYQSHLHQAKTDNLSYLSKLEKTFESSPQLILQLYVLMRELSHDNNIKISYITVLSILCSLVSLSSKVITDDEQMFFKQANKKHKIPFLSRAIFRICEISARLSSITLFAAYFGANFLILIIVMDILTHILLFDHGLLDTDPLNVMSYLLCTMNVGITPTAKHQLISRPFMDTHTCFDKVWHNLFIFMMRIQFIYISQTNYYYLSYYLIRSKCIQSFIILIFISIISLIDSFSDWHFDCFMCTDHDDREAMYRSSFFFIFLIYAYLSIFISYFTFSKYNVRFMKSGMILDRDPWILFINFSYFDSIRAFKEKNGPNAFVLNQTLRKVVTENARLPQIELNANENEVIDIYPQLPYLIQELNHSATSQFLYQLLEDAIMRYHDNFLSFFLSSYIVESIDKYDPISYKNANSGLNLLEIAINGQNNVIIQTVYLNCPQLLRANQYSSFSRLWNERHIATIDVMITNDESLLLVEPSGMEKSILWHFIDNKYDSLISFLAPKMRREHFENMYSKTDSLYIFHYLLKHKYFFALQQIIDKLDWNARSQYIERFGLIQHHYALHPMAYAIVTDQNVKVLSYLLSHKQGLGTINEACVCKIDESEDKEDIDQFGKHKFKLSPVTVSLTPLIIAAIFKKIDAIKVLIYHGAERNPNICQELDASVLPYIGRGRNLSNSAMWQLYFTDKLQDKDVEFCETVQNEAKSMKNELLTDEKSAVYVRKLIENDNNYILNILMDRMTQFDAYLIESFCTLCGSNNALKILKDVLHNSGQDKLKKIVELNTLDPYLNASSLDACQLLYDIGFPLEDDAFSFPERLIYTHSLRKNYQIVEWLIFNGITLQREPQHHNILMEACSIYMGHICLPALIPICDVQKAMDIGSTPLLHVAVLSCDIITVRILLENGIKDINAIRDKKDRTVIYEAILADDPDLYDLAIKDMISKPSEKMLYHLLFDLDCDLSVVDNRGNTPLHVATTHDNVDKVKLILKRLCQYEDNGVYIINQRNNEGLTALQKAIDYGLVDIAKTLIDTNKFDLNGILEYGYGKESERVFNMLVRNGLRFQQENESKIIDEIKIKYKNNQLWKEIVSFYTDHQSKQNDPEYMKQWTADHPYDDCNNFDVWKNDNIDATSYFNRQKVLIKDYRDGLENKESQSINMDVNESVNVDINTTSDRNKDVLDLCLAMIDNNDRSIFAESYFDEIIMHFMFDAEWEILKNICAASQYEPILLKAYQHKIFKANINSIICTHENDTNAQLIVESLTFSYGNRYIDVKDIHSKNKKRQSKDEETKEDEHIDINKEEKKDINKEEQNMILQECMEFIMKQTICTKLKSVKTTSVTDKLMNHIKEHNTDTTKESLEKGETKEEEYKEKIENSAKADVSKYERLRKIGMGLSENAINKVMKMEMDKPYIKNVLWMDNYITMVRSNFKNRRLSISHTPLSVSYDSTHFIPHTPSSDDSRTNTSDKYFFQNHK